MTPTEEGFLIIINNYLLDLVNYSTTLSKGLWQADRLLGDLLNILLLMKGNLMKIRFLFNVHFLVLNIHSGIWLEFQIKLD